MDPEVLQWEKNWSFWGPTILTDSHDKDEGVAFSPAELLQDWISFELNLWILVSDVVPSEVEVAKESKAHILCL